MLIRTTAQDGWCEFPSGDEHKKQNCDWSASAVIAVSTAAYKQQQQQQQTGKKREGKKMM